MRSHHAGPTTGPLDGPAYDTVEDTRPTGLLTRFVPTGLRHSAIYGLLLRLTRVLQFVSSVVSLGLFSRRLAKLRNLINAVKTRRGVNAATGAVEGILVAAVVYTLIAMLLSLIKKQSSPGGRTLRWLWVLLDLLFVGAFIAVAVLTRPNGGSAGPRHCYNGVRDLFNNESNDNSDDTCNLPWGTFILAIISTILHAITAAFHEVRDHHKRSRREAMEADKALHHGHAADPTHAAHVAPTHNTHTTPATHVTPAHTTAAPSANPAVY